MSRMIEEASEYFSLRDRFWLKTAAITVAGRNARDILNTLIERGLVSRLDHAGYLGRELERAEIALRLKRSYVQDEPLWSSEKR